MSYFATATLLLCVARYLRCSLPVLAALIVAMQGHAVQAQVQEIVFDSPATAAGGAPYLGTGSPLIGVGGTLSFHLTQNASLQSVRFDATAAGVEELTVSRFQGCAGSGSTGVVAAGSICSVDYFLTPIFAGIRERSGTLRVVTETGAYAAGVAFTVNGPQVVFAPGTISSLALDAARTPSAFALDGAGNRYLASAATNTVEKVDAKTGAVTLIAGNGDSTASGDGGAATAAGVPNPVSMAVAPSGDVYVIANDVTADRQALRKIEAKTGRIFTMYTFASYGMNGSVAVDRNGTIYLAEPYAGALVQVSQAGSVTPLVCYPPGASVPVFAPSATTLPPASYLRPTVLALDGNGHVYFVSRNGEAADGVYVAPLPPASCASNATLVASGFGGASGLAVDAAGNVYVGDPDGNRIAKIATGDGVVSTVAGAGTRGYSGDGGPATAGQLQGMGPLALDALGNLYVLDMANNVVRLIERHDASLSFPDTSLGVNSAAQAVTLENVGSMDLTLNPPAASGATNPSLTGGFVPGTGGTCPFLPGSAAPTVAAGASCTQQVSFRPLAAGTTTGTLIFQDNGGGSAAGQLAQTVALSGRGTVAMGTVTLSPSSASFGSLPVGAVGGLSTFTVSNTGGAAVKITAILLSDDASFHQTTNCGATLAANSTCSVLVSFSPQRVGGLTATLEVDDDAAPYQQTMALSGTGLAKTAGSYSVSVTPSALSLKAGETGTVAFVFTPSGGYTGTVTFACNGLPSGAACSFPASTLTADGSDKVQTSQLTISTTGIPGANALNEPRAGDGTIVVTVFGLNSLLLGMVFVRHRARPGDGAQAFVLALLLSGLAGLAGCGSGVLASDATAGTSAVSVTATSAAANATAGVTTQTANFMLTITP